VLANNVLTPYVSSPSAAIASSDSSIEISIVDEETDSAELLNNNNNNNNNNNAPRKQLIGGGIFSGISSLVSNRLDRFFFSEPLQKAKDVTRVSHGDADKLKVVKLGVQGMNCCTSCSANIEAGLRNKLGILDVKSFSFTEKIVVQYDPAHVDQLWIIEAIARIGFKAELLSDDTTEGESKALISNFNFI